MSETKLNLIAGNWKAGESVSINLAPGRDLGALFSSWKKTHARTLLRTRLDGLLSHKLVRELENLFWPDRAETPLAEWPDHALDRTAAKLQAWGAPIEHNSSEKAASYLRNYQGSIEPLSGQVIGSFAFLWGQKQERTPTWYGMFLPNGDKLAAVDAMTEASCRADRRPSPVARSDKMMCPDCSPPSTATDYGARSGSGSRKRRPSWAFHSGIPPSPSEAASRNPTTVERFWSRSVRTFTFSFIRAWVFSRLAICAFDMGSVEKLSLAILFIPF